MPVVPNERDYYNEVSDSIKSLFDLTTRIDERVKHMQIIQQEVQEKTDAHLKQNHGLDGRLQVLETKVHSLNGGTTNELKDKIRVLETKITIVESIVSKSESRWEKVIKWIVQMGWIIVAAWALTQLGLQPPQVP